MAKQIQLFSFSGMQRDMSVSKHPANFLYDARNIRLTARGSDTLLSVTNEKGTRDAAAEVPGLYLGHCLLNQYLVVFSRDYNSSSSPDYITRIDLSMIDLPADTKDRIVTLYQGNLGFSASYPITAIASYENKDIQKVYWTDGKNQPRVINIVADDKHRAKFNDEYFDFVSTLKLQEEVKVRKLLGGSGQFAPGVIQYAFTYYRKYGQESSIFYTTPLLYISHKDRGASPEDKVENAFQITVDHVDPNFDFLRIYSIQRTSLNATPYCRRVQDLSLADVVFEDTEKGVTGPIPSDTNPFLQIGEKYEFIEQHTLETNFGNFTTECYGYTKGKYPNLKMKTSDGVYMWPDDAGPNAVFWVTRNKVFFKGERAYWIFVSASQTSRGQLHLDRFAPKNDTVVFVDNGYGGDTIDPTELLYKGGETIASGTIEQKDGTLFLGDILLTRPQIVDKAGDNLKTQIQNISISPTTRNFYFLEGFSTSDSIESYEYSNQLTGFEDSAKTSSTSCGGFKRGDIYRLGIQFQHKSGRWSDPVFIKDVEETNAPNLEGSGNSVVLHLPAFAAFVNSAVAQNLYNKGYRRARALVVMPQMQDRRVICQGVTCKTLYTSKQRDKQMSLYAQSSWFYRPGSGEWGISDKRTVSPTAGDLPYTSNYEDYYPETGYTTDNRGKTGPIRAVEIQGQYDKDDKFKVDNTFLTLNSPEIEFDNQLWVMDFTGTSYKQAGRVHFLHTWSDIDIQTETPTASDSGTGFIREMFSESGNYGIVSGLFYEDWLLDDDMNSDIKVKPHQGEKSPVKYVVYPWQRRGSLNNDTNRPATAGVQSSVLKKKIISHLKYTRTDLLSEYANPVSLSAAPQLFSSNEIGVVKVGNTRAYQGNIDTVLNPYEQEGIYFSFNGTNWGDFGNANKTVDFKDKIEWKTWHDDTKHPVEQEPFPDRCQLAETAPASLYWYDTVCTRWRIRGSEIGDQLEGLVTSKDLVRMKYKSTPHLVMQIPSAIIPPANCLPVVEILQPENENRFGGTNQDALMANRWIPCGKPVTLNTTGDTKVLYEYGDTYYQRYDCLKTYAFTPEDINQIVEIGSFMLETHVNIDGRYDRNRGQLSNINMSPQNFNLLNPVYSQQDNFFTYRIMDDDYYRINTFPNQITWTKGKMSGADVDLWTNITLASTYDMDGSKGKVVSLNTWRDHIFCFQQKGISQVLFNSRVQIPTSDNNPIEISNNYKVDGYRYLSEGIGCNDQRQIKETPAAIYFIDSVGNHLYTVGENLADVSQSHNMSSWAAQAPTDRLVYDEVNKDLYQVGASNALCYSEILEQFTSFMDYGDTSLIESYGQRVFTMKDSKLYAMFEGDYCNFFGEPKPYSMTFISNENAQLDKIFTNLEFRACVEGDGEYDVNTGKFTPTLPFDSLETWDEYQHGKMVLKHRDGHNASVHHSKEGISHLARKFRIWRTDIPRDNLPNLVENIGFNNFGVRFNSTIRKPHPNDRMRNTWLYLTLQKDAGTLKKPLKQTEIHDMMVTYFT